MGAGAASQRKKPSEPGHGFTSLSQISPVLSFDRKSIRGAPEPPAALKHSAAQLRSLASACAGRLGLMSRVSDSIPSLCCPGVFWPPTLPLPPLRYFSRKLSKSSTRFGLSIADVEIFPSKP